MENNLTEKTKEWYTEYYAKLGQWRNDILRNPEVPFQLFATEAALLSALRRIQVTPETTKVLDVGCGSGSGLLNFLRFGFSPENLHGLDLQPERLEAARLRLPSAVSLQVGDATKMPYDQNAFDLVFESTMFVQITDDNLAQGIAREMVRVTKPGGHIVLSDWRYSKPFNQNYRGLDKARLARLFPVSTDCHLLRRHRGALLPPLGRFLSKYAHPLYFPCRWLAPVLCGHVITVLRKAG